MELVIWTGAYTPFLMGGDVNGPIGTRVGVGDPVDLGSGFTGHVIVSPLTGESCVAEATTGAIVGSNLEEVRHDVMNSDPAVMRAQIAQALTKSERVRVLENEDFWTRFAAAK